MNRGDIGLNFMRTMGLTAGTRFSIAVSAFEDSIAVTPRRILKADESMREGGRDR